MFTGNICFLAIFKNLKKGGNRLEYIASTSKVQNIGQTAWVGINKKLLILL